jgi:Transposase domain (DUF772)
MPGEVLTKQADQVETVWDAILPELVRTLPDDLARLDQVLDAPQILKRFEHHWGRANLHVGRPSIPMATYVRLLALKHRHGWGYERLVRHLGDSFHLRRFCRLSILDEVPDESTVRKLTRRLGPELVDDLIREVVKLAVIDRGFRVRAMRCDSTVQESDIRFPTDCGVVVQRGEFVNGGLAPPGVAVAVAAGDDHKPTVAEAHPPGAVRDLRDRTSVGPALGVGGSRRAGPSSTSSTPTLVPAGAIRSPPARWRGGLGHPTPRTCCMTGATLSVDGGMRS